MEACSCCKRALTKPRHPAHLWRLQRTNWRLVTRGISVFVSAALSDVWKQLLYHTSELSFTFNWQPKIALHVLHLRVWYMHLRFYRQVSYVQNRINSSIAILHSCVIAIPCKWVCDACWCWSIVHQCIVFHSHILKTKHRPTVTMEHYVEVGSADSVAAFRSSERPLLFK